MYLRPRPLEVLAGGPQARQNIRLLNGILLFRELSFLQAKVEQEQLLLDAANIGHLALRHLPDLLQYKAQPGHGRQNRREEKFEEHYTFSSLLSSLSRMLTK